jgi:adenine-specific DNA-methyltransferase
MDLQDLKKSINDISMKYTKNTESNYLKQYGQFFTINESLLSLLINDYNIDNQNKRLEILEPSCGTGTIIFECLKIPNANITGVEIDAKLANDTSKLFNDVENVSIIRSDFLKMNDEKQYDLIVGNPPYFEMKKNDIDKTVFDEVMCGRTNIYTLFIYKSITMLKEGGELRFIIPQTFLSGKYFSKIRAYIERNCEIIDIVKFSKNNLFDRALQSVIILKLKKTKPKQSPDKFVVMLNGEVYFVKDKSKLGLTENIKTIGTMGCTVKTGSVVWNQHKTHITKEKTKTSIPLLMATNLKSGKLIIDKYMTVNEETQKHVQNGPFILINRIVGLNPPKLNIVFENDSTHKYFIENHINVVRGSLEKLQEIYESLQKKETLCFLEELLGSTQLSQYELQNIVPIF